MVDADAQRHPVVDLEAAGPLAALLALSRGPPQDDRPVPDVLGVPVVLGVPAPGLGVLLPGHGSGLVMVVLVADDL